jgi:TatD DNase family protein
MQLRLVDFHCHLDLFPDPVQAVARAEKAGVYTLTVTTTPKAWPRNHELTRSTSFVRAALGLHPQLVAERGAEIAIWEQYLEEARYVGEVGLDAGPRFYRSLELQKEIFEKVLKRCSEVGGKILTVHSVRASRIVIDMIEALFPSDRGRVVLHWFTGSQAEARRAAELGCYFSINAEMLKGDRGRSLVASLPRDRILTETDAPFTQINDKSTFPEDVIEVVAGLARLLRTEADVAKETVLRNLRALLKEDG